MTRLLVSNEWYERIDPASYFEKDFEDRLLANAAVIFEGWRVVSFKVDVFARDSGYGPKRPDLALIHPEYREWWVVEVEVATHNLATHVVPQVAVFSFAAYDQKHAGYLVAQCPELDRERLEILVTSVQPGVAVIVNDQTPGWKEYLDQYGAKLSAVMPYRSRVGRTAYLVSGDLPTSTMTLVSRCVLVDGLPRALALQNPAAVVAKPGAQVAIETTAGTSTWTYEHLNRTAFLFSTGRYPFSAGARQFELHRTAGGRLKLEIIQRRDAWTSR